MSNLDVAPGSEGGITPIAQTVPAPNTDSHSPRDLANYLTDFRNKRDAAENEQPEAPAKAAEPEKVADEANAAPAEEATSETETKKAEPEAELPPIEPPRSLTAEEKEAFKALPRPAQEILERRIRDSEVATRRGQNDTAEQRKALEAERAKAKELQQQFEQIIPQYMQALQDAQMGEFADIKTQNDVDKLAAEDWPRFAKYQAHLMKVGQLEHLQKQSQERQHEEFRSKWNEFAAKEDAAFLDAAPEMADRATATKVADASVAMLKSLGFTEAELAKTWSGEASVSLRDHRMQLLIRDAARYRDALKIAPAKAAKVVPQVQKPGTSQSRATDGDAQVKSLEQRLNQSGNWKDGAALLMARRARS